MAKRSIGMVLAEYSDNQKKKKEGKDSIETVMNLIDFPLLDQTSSNSVISTTSNDLSNWSRLSSLWPLLYGTSCCFIEFASLIGSRFDFDRYGLVPRSSPRQADLILTAGTVTMKMAPSLVRLYEQMPEPKYVIAMGLEYSPRILVHVEQTMLEFYQQFYFYSKKWTLEFIL